MGPAKSQTSDLIAAALLEAADWCACFAGDMHAIHLNVRGNDFDAIHEACKEYYEALDGDYDSFAEFALCYPEKIAPSKVDAAARIKYKSFDMGEGTLPAAAKCCMILEEVVYLFHETWKAVSKIEDCPIAVGVANWLQGRIEYWAKEQAFFAKRRIA